MTIVCFVVAVVCFLLFFRFSKFRDKGKQAFIFLLIGIASTVGAVKLDNAAGDKTRQNFRTVSESREIQEIVSALQFEYVPNSYTPDEYVDAFTIVYESDEHLHAQKPYIVIGLSVDKGTLKAHASKVYFTSDGSDVGNLSACKTICFVLSDTWATAQYNTGGSRILGTSQRLRCYLYDVDAAAVFSGTELKAKSLPDKASRAPHYSVDDKEIRKWIESDM